MLPQYCLLHGCFRGEGNLNQKAKKYAKPLEDIEEDLKTCPNSFLLYFFQLSFVMLVFILLLRAFSSFSSSSLMILALVSVVINNKSSFKVFLKSPYSYSCVLHKRGGTVKADLKIRKKNHQNQPSHPKLMIEIVLLESCITDFTVRR